MKKETYDFSAGPATLFKEVVQQLSNAILHTVPGHFSSLITLNHRDPKFIEITQKLIDNLRLLLHIPSETHDILFVHGGASVQFSTIAMMFQAINPKEAKGYYQAKDVFSIRAFQEAKRYLPQSQAITSTPDSPILLKEYEYFYYTSNETINGIYSSLNDIQNIVNIQDSKGYLVCDMTSCLMSQSIDISKYDLIFAGTQKNLSLSGLAVVILSKRLLNAFKAVKGQHLIPKVLDYGTLQEKLSSVNTSNVIAIYTAYLTTEHLIRHFGTLEKVHAYNKQKAQLLYDFIDAHSDFYINSVPKQSRSIMNITLTFKNDPNNQLTQQFLSEAQENGLLQLAGHSEVGGIRISLYNAMSIDGVKALLNFMETFYKQNLHR